MAVKINPNTFTIDIDIPESLGLLTSLPKVQQITPIEEVTPISANNMNVKITGGLKKTIMVHDTAVMDESNNRGNFLLLSLSDIPPIKRDDTPEINNTIEIRLAA